MVAQDVLHHHHVEENVTALERYDGAARLRSAVVVTGLDRGVLTRTARPPNCSAAR